MTATLALVADAPAVAPPALAPPPGRIGLLGTATTVAGRTLRQFRRTPQLIVVGALTSAMFLLIFRYVFGGAIGTGGVDYADFLIPGLLVSAGLFSGGVVGVAEDIDSGVYDRLRSLPLHRSGILLGRSLADTLLVGWSMLATLALGLATGFRFSGGVGGVAAALGLCLVFGAAFSWPMIHLGLCAGSAQAAQGLSFLAFPLVFVSSTYVPVESMPGWLQPVAEHQPFTMMVGAVRSWCLGPEADAVLGHSAGWFTVRALAWSVAIVAVFAPLATRRFARS